MSDSEAWRKPYQDVQDLRMNKMYFSCSRLGKILIMSESGCPGFKDEQDVFFLFLLTPWAQSLRPYLLTPSTHEKTFWCNPYLSAHF
ncbi:hypothetical protein [Anabaena sp. WA102]|jgi:hypothetical protein|uniref:hypothetical protein n=1 Tax=Anabaena sp. WA102 TaxID=1647413 RepID=UPI001900E129|nr:hypothetical protein [Anabaena sp. WA102]